jgi:RNA polymerase sigma-70 factor (ECF subfamily)
VSGFGTNGIQGLEVASEIRLPPPDGDFLERIRSARAGSAEALGQLLEECRPYLLLIANAELPEGLRGKAGASDLVQETFLQANNHFHRFHDDGEAELLAWLRRILLNRVANLKRRYAGTDKRQFSREVPLADGSAQGLPDVPATEPSPSSRVAAQERDVALCQALEQLPADYREVLQLRQEDLPFEEVGRRLGRSAEAARKLWARAVVLLSELLGPDHDSR